MSITLLNKRVPVFFKSRWKRTATMEAMNATTTPRTVVFFRPILKQTRLSLVQHLDLHVICAKYDWLSYTVYWHHVRANNISVKSDRTREISCSYKQWLNILKQSLFKLLTHLRQSTMQVHKSSLKEILWDWSKRTLSNDFRHTFLSWMKQHNKPVLLLTCGQKKNKCKDAEDWQKTPSKVF